MKISFQKQNNNHDRWKGWHILTIAEAGFSMLDLYARIQNGLDIQIVGEFADQINKTNKTGTLYPQAPISAVPKRLFREITDTNSPENLTELKRHIYEFLDLNRKKIHAQQIVIDFHVSPSPVPAQYLSETEAIFRSKGKAAGIDEVVFLT